MSSEFEYELSLRVWHPSLTPEQISEELALVSHAGWAAGTPRKLVGGATGSQPMTYWSARLDAETASLADALQRACGMLRPHKRFLDEILDTGGRLEFFVGWFSGSNSGEVFPRLLLGEIAELGIDLALDVYGASAGDGDA